MDRHPQASAFHEKGWLEALSRTYGYKPVVFTTARPCQPLNDGIVFCRVSSWITGTRLVSLPFADHCDPLLEGQGGNAQIVEFLRKECDQRRWRYLELRPSSPLRHDECGLNPGISYWMHELDTTGSLDEVFHRMHKNSFRRKIARAEREHITCQVGNSPQFVKEFYRLLLVTRRRHLLLPHPRNWFRNLVAAMGDKVQIRLALKDGVAVGAMLTLRHRSTITYKYGCSDERWHKAGVMPYLFWKLIGDAKTSNISRIDLGRTDLDNDGLIRFKDRLGATRERMTYYRYAPGKQSKAVEQWQASKFRNLCSILPDTLFTTAGSVVYRHIG